MDFSPIDIEKDLAEANYMFKLHKNHLYQSNKYSSTGIYQDKAIEELYKKKREESLAQIISALMVCIEANDVLGLNGIIEKIKEIRFNANIHSHEVEIIVKLLDQYVKRNFDDYSKISGHISLISDLLTNANIQVSLEWKVYYLLFITLYGESKIEFSTNYPEKYIRNVSLCEMIKKAKKFFYYTYEDYSFLKQEILHRLIAVDGQMLFGLLILQLFLPIQFLSNDIELLGKLFNILEYYPKCSNYVLRIFSDILQQGYNLEIDQSMFIEKVFSLAYCLLSNGLSFTYFNWPETIYKDRYINNSICYMIAVFLIDEKFLRFRNEVNRKFQILVNLISAHLIEKGNNDFEFALIRLLLRNTRLVSCAVTEYEVSQLDSFFEYSLIEDFRPRINEIVNMLMPVISKCLLYYNSGTYTVFVEYLAFAQYSPQLNEIIRILFENSDANFNLFLKKATVFIRSIISDIDNRDTFSFFTALIDTAVDKISCISSSMNKNILDLFTVTMIILMNKETNIPKNTPESNYTAFLCKVNHSCVIVVKKMFQLIDFFANMFENLPFSLFISHLSIFVNEKEFGNICDMIVDTIKENTLKEDNQLLLMSTFINYFSKRNSGIGKRIWQFVYSSLVTVISVNDGTVSSFHPEKNKLYPHLLHNQIGKYSVNDFISNQQFAYFQKLLPYLSFYRDINIDEFLILAGLLLNENNKKKMKIIYTLLKNFIYKVTLPEVIDNKILYPSDEKLSIVSIIYEFLVKPYELLIQEQTQVMSNEKNIGNDKTSNQELAHFQELLVIYLRLSSGFVIQCNNIFMRSGNTYCNESIYTKLISIQENIISNTSSFYSHCKKWKLLPKTEKYFRRHFYNQIVDMDRIYHMKLISYSRQFIFDYRELRYSEVAFAYEKILCSTIYSHVKLFTILEEMNNCKLSIIKHLLRMHIRYEDKILSSDPNFRLLRMIKNISPDSEIALSFFNQMMDYFETKLTKLSKSQEILTSDIKKFNRIVYGISELLYATNEKISCKTLLLKRLYKIREIFGQMKFTTSEAFSIILTITRSIYYSFSKVKSLFDKQITRNLNPYILLPPYNSSTLYINGNDREKYFPTNQIIERSLIIQETMIINKIKLNSFIDECFQNENFFPSNNSNNSLHTIIDSIILVKLSLDILNEKDYLLLQKIETVFFTKFLHDDNFPKKMIYLTGLGVIQSMKYKTSKIFIKKENGNQATKDAMDSPDMKRNFYASRMKNQFEKQFNPISTQIFEDLLSNNEEGFEKLFDNFYQIQDYLEYANTMSSKSSGLLESLQSRLFYVLNPQYQDSILTYPRNFMMYSLSATPSIFSLHFARIFFYMFYFSNFCNYDLLFTTFEKYKDTTKEGKNDTVIVNVLVTFLYALVKKDKITKNYIRIHQNIKRLMTIYTFGMNKSVDSEIFNFFSSIIRLCSPNEIRIIFTQESPLLLFMEYDYYFALKIISILFENFSHRCHFIFDDFNLKKLREMKEEIMGDSFHWRKLSNEFVDFYYNFLYISRIIVVECTTKYNVIFSPKMLEEINSVQQFYSGHKGIDSLKLIHLVLRESVLFCFQRPQILCDLLSECPYYLQTDPINGRGRLDSVVNLFNSPRLQTQLFTFQDRIKLIIYLQSQDTLFNSRESANMMTDVIKKLTVPCLDRCNSDDIFPSFLSLLYKIKFNDCKDYFIKHAFSSFILSFNPDTSEKIIEELSNNIWLMYPKYEVMSNVMILLTFLIKDELNLSDSTKKLIFALKKITSELLKHKGSEAKVIKRFVTEIFDKNNYRFMITKKYATEDFMNAIDDLSVVHSYFI